MQYRLLCLDEENRQCHINLTDLLEKIRRESYKHRTIDPDKWMCTNRLFFDYEIVVDTNIGPFQKINDIPCICTYIKYKQTDGMTVGSVIFLSKNKYGTHYADGENNLHNSTHEFTYEDETWFYNIIFNCRITNSNEIKTYSNSIFDSINDAINDIFSTANVREAEYWSMFPREGDTLFLAGIKNKNGIENPLISIDTDGVIHCNGIKVRSEVSEC